MLVGLIIRVSPGHFIQEHVSFSYSYFFNLLLPPIILNSGYELHQANFFRNIGSILTFAFAGTFLAAIVLGVLLYIWTAIGLEGVNISFVDAISVGATLSATDPVTILSIFNVYKVDPKLYTIIFGESLLNDAVCIVMFETAQKFSGESVSIASFFKGTGMFLMTFTLSLLIGTIVGIMTALVLKHSHVRRFPQIESCLVLLFAYASYFFSNGCHMSGIVSLLFCGITLKHYAYYNMSRRTQIAIKYIFQLLAQLSENFIFVYLGLSLFTQEDLIFKPILIIVTALGICVSRWAAVFPLSKVINFVSRARAKQSNRPISDEIPQPYQMMLFWAGLRGAVGVALAAGLEGEHGPSLRATVLVIVVLTVIVFGGTTARMLEILGIRTGVMEEEQSDDEFDIEAVLDNNAYQRDVRSSGGFYMDQRGGGSRSESLSRLRRSSSYHDDHEGTGPDSDAESDVSDLPPMASARGSVPLADVGSSSLSGVLSRADDRARWFKEFDEQVLKPVLLDSSPGVESPKNGSNSR
jgi:sodium/hydrogen exchanger-like protein 6/7